MSSDLLCPPSPSAVARSASRSASVVRKESCGELDLWWNYGVRVLLASGMLALAAAALFYFSEEEPPASHQELSAARKPTHFEQLQPHTRAIRKKTAVS